MNLTISLLASLTFSAVLWGIDTPKFAAAHFLFVAIQFLVAARSLR
jgi:hypothetical protein